VKTVRPLFFLIMGLALLGAATAAAAQTSPLAVADGLLNSPTLDVPQARLALALYEEVLPAAGSARVSLLTRLGRVCFILGDLAEKGERQGYYEKGRTYAELLLKEKPGGVEGHYWLALNLCGLADVGGTLQGHRLLPHILEELQRSLAVDESYDQAGAHRVLGRIYFEAPGRPFSVGDLQKSLAHLTAATRLAPENSTNHLYLAQTLLRLGEPSKARLELESVLKSTRHAIHPGGLEDDRKEARRLLAEFEGK
jgi:tetratricopeptide (TPR) repeat protein